MRPERDILWAERTREEIADAARQGTVVVIPVGSTEQHGHHLPLNTDCRTAEYVARTAACRSTDPSVLVTPTVSVALSPHHMAFPGTITLRLGTFLQVLGEMCECITAHGFERILLVNGHGGNAEALGAAALELRSRLDRQIRAVTWFALCGPEMDAVREGVGESIGHSGELETSVLLAIDADVVRTDRYALVPGITDAPDLATAEKGRTILDAAVEGVLKALREIAAAPGRDIPGIEMVQR